ncbi:substrate-binding and VWA domain-containing protein [Streptomyces apocyni]|uniref:substrate-binding and VWA domain-containing protein n=1 Tax=Streptomyces apocyni TaxID=2654677 RepID=UPI0012EAC62A|nr:substrate-binding and VWA domain-containing protein [Streptomyces apocyni]
MGRHHRSDRHARDRATPRPRTRQRSVARTRQRSVALATVVVLGVAAGTAVAVSSDLLSFSGFSGSCADTAVRVNLVASPDMAPTLRAAATQARKREVTSDGQCLDVRVSARASYKMADALRAGDDLGYEVWVPDSELWLDRAAQGDARVPLTAAGNIAHTPVAMGAVPSAAKSLGWPRKQYSWAELTLAATSDDQLKLGAADPARSATGLLALAAIGTSAERSSGPEAETQVAATAKLLSQRTSDSDAQALDTLARDDSGTERGNPRRNQALLVSEQAAFTHNATAGPEGGLALFYPKDGAPQLDYPFALINEIRLSTDQSRAALRFMHFLGEDPGQAILTKNGFRSGNGTPPAALVSAAGGRAPQPYATATAEPPTPEQLLEALGLWTVTVQSARLTTVVDASSSMAAPVPGRDQSRMEVTRNSLVRALDQFTADDEIGLWEFSTLLDGKRDYRKLVETARLGDRTDQGTSHRTLLTKAFNELRPIPGGYTGLYDTTLAAYKEARETYVSGKFNAVVVLTDGVNQDPGSLSRSALVRELQRLSDPKHPIPLIAIAVGPDADKDEVAELAKATGGSGHQVNDPAQIHQVILKAIMTAGQN